MQSAHPSFAVTFLPVLAEQAPQALEEARARFERENLPAFVRHTGRELIAYLTFRLDDMRQEPTETLEAEFAEGLLQLEATIDFGRAVLRESTRARRRLAALRARAEQAPLSALWRGPVADAYSALEARLHRLERGLYPLSDFPHAFEQAAAEFEALLSAPEATAEAP